MAEQKKITLIIENEELDCDKPRIKLIRPKKCDTVKWVCDKAIKKFAIDFGWNTPFEEVCYQSSQGAIKPIFKDKVPAAGRYKYTVCAENTNGDLLIDDPHIIIRR